MPHGSRADDGTGRGQRLAALVDDLAAVRRDLLTRSYLYDDPAAYEAGVEEALESLAARRLAAGGARRVATSA